MDSIGESVLQEARSLKSNRVTMVTNNRKLDKMTKVESPEYITLDMRSNAQEPIEKPNPWLYDQTGSQPNYERSAYWREQNFLEGNSHIYVTMMLHTIAQ